MASHPLVLFDGVCHLCDAAVKFTIANDPEARFRFAPLQSEAAAAALARFGPAAATDSIVLVDDAGVHDRSDAALRIASRLAWPLPLLAVFFAVPKAARDAAYAWIARNRYRWFGRRDTCVLPAPGMEARFL